MHDGRNAGAPGVCLQIPSLSLQALRRRGMAEKDSKMDASKRKELVDDLHDDLHRFMEANPDCSREEYRKHVNCVRSRFSLSRNDFDTLRADHLIRLKDERSLLADELMECYGCAENDVEGAAIGILALNLTHPDHDDDEYAEEANRIMDEHCPLLKLSCDLPHELQLRADEMMDMIYDAAERMRAEFPPSI
jgi:hypothetical protein